MKGYSLTAKLPVSEIGNRGSNPLILEFQNYLSKKTYAYKYYLKENSLFREFFIFQRVLAIFP